MYTEKPLYLAWSELIVEQLIKNWLKCLGIKK